MDRATQVALIRRIVGLLDARTTQLADAPYVNHVSTYTSRAQLERERTVLFRDEPLFVGLTRDLPAPGTFLAVDADVPLLVVRARSGELRAFLNVCRHRGAPVATGAGTVERFVCPYHGWVYDEAGRLLAQPCREGFEGLATDGLGLTAVPVAERHGMIFVRPSAGAPVDVDAHLAGAQHELAALGLEGYEPFARHEIQRALNWKLVVDTFLEAYHVPSLHRQTLGPAILGSPALWDPFGRSSRLVAVRRTITEVRRQPEASWNLLANAVVLYNVFPNTVLIHQIDHIEVVQAYPGPSGPDDARIVFALYTPTAATSPEARRHFQANLDLLVNTVEHEDFHLGERIQRGFHAGGHGTVVYGRNEPGLAHYHRAINGALGVDATSPR